MMAGNPNWWSMQHPPSLFPHHPQYALGSSNSLLPLNSNLPADHAQDYPPPQSWSHFLLGTTSSNSGFSGDEDRLGSSTNNSLSSDFIQLKKLENWEEDHILNGNNNPLPQRLHHHVIIKQEVSQNSNLLYGQGQSGQAAAGISDHMEDHHDELQQANRSCSSGANWSSQQVLGMPSSPPRSCITTSLGSNISSNMLDFSYNNSDHHHHGRNQITTTDHSSECNSTATGGVCKKARVQPSSSQPPLKVRKEKLGDRITALHQLVSPFGKTDTASVLLEAIGYIRFLQSQIEALSSPYLGPASKKIRNNQQYVQGERNCVFPEDPGQVDGQDHQKLKDLKSRGLCLVPVSCTQHVGSDNGADYWAPAYGSGF